MRFQDLRNTCLLWGIDPALLADALAFFPNFESGIEKYFLDRCVQLAWTLWAMRQMDDICPHVVVGRFHIVWRSMSAVLVHGVQSTQFVKSLNDSNHKAVETRTDNAPIEIINAFLFPVGPLEREAWYWLRLLLISLVWFQAKSISFHAIDLMSHQSFVPSAVLLVQLKHLQADPWHVHVEPYGQGGPLVGSRRAKKSVINRACWLKLASFLSEELFTSAVTTCTPWRTATASAVVCLVGTCGGKDWCRLVKVSSSLPAFLSICADSIISTLPRMYLTFTFQGWPLGDPSSVEAKGKWLR